MKRMKDYCCSATDRRAAAFLLCSLCIFVLAAAPILAGGDAGAFVDGTNSVASDVCAADAVVRDFESRLTEGGTHTRRPLDPIQGAVSCEDICHIEREACLVASFSCGPFFALCAAICHQNFANCLRACP